MTPIPLAVVVLLAAPVAALLAGFFVVGPKRPEWTHWPMLASCALVCVASAALAARVYTGWGIDVTIATWMVAGDWGVPFGLRVDGLTAAMLAMVSVVGALIQVYASAYMRGDPGFSRFFLYFHLFYLAMIGFLLSNNYVQLYLFWEMVGLASYLLIGFWNEKTAARAAALQAFLTNRVGDFGLMLAVLILLPVFHGNTRFEAVFPLVAAVNPRLIALVGLLFFWAAAAKSAQFPLYFWLPDAMEGPTPVSALMHAATMVTAGIFLLARSWPLIAAVGNLPEFIGLVGAVTAIAAGIIACTKTDLKRILAYSTVSHLGLMAFALGLGQVAAAMFHLITHGFFKAVLFLCVGNIAHGLGRSTASVDEVGGLAKKMPVTFACFTVAALSLAGIWPLAGFYSKDAIVDAALRRGGAAAAAVLVIAALSAFYIFRMLFLTFAGPRDNQAGARGVHEAEPAMSVPIVFLSLGALGAGWLSSGFSTMISSGWPLRRGLAPLPEFSWAATGAGMLAAGLGAAAAFVLTMSLPAWDWEWRRGHPRLEAVFSSDFGWKEVVQFFSHLFWNTAQKVGRDWDEGILDGWVESTARWARRAGQAGEALACGLLNDYLWWMLAGTSFLLFAVLR